MMVVAGTQQRSTERWVMDVNRLPGTGSGGVQLNEGVAHLVVRLHQQLFLEQVELGIVVDNEQRTLEVARLVRHHKVDASSRWRRIHLLLLTETCGWFRVISRSLRCSGR